jgi:hypothetical protein
MIAVLVLLALLMAGAAPAEELADAIEQHVSAALKTLPPRPQPPSVTEFASLATTGSWTEMWPTGNGEERRAVTAKIWNASIQACLDKHSEVFLPAALEPYYLDAPVILKPGQRLIADRTAEIRLKPGTSTCMVRNEHVVSGRNHALPPDLQPDTDIVIEGGIWTTLATSPGQTNGNARARADAQNSLPGSYGLFLLQNVRRVRVRNVVIREGKVFGLHLSAISDFLIENIRFERHGRDGVHVNGPASYGVIRNIHGVTHDDLVALNAWDWLDSTTSFGKIDHILVERVSGAPMNAGAADAIRLLPGVKHFPSGATLDCPVTDCVLRDITDIREFKLYDQPNLEMGRDKDFSDPVGTLRNIHLERLVFTRPGWINVAATTEHLSVDDVEFRFDLAHPANAAYHLVEIGPMSMTWKSRADDPSTWVEVFSPDRDVIVRDFRLTNARATLGGTTTSVADPMTRLVNVRDMHLNPDYPKATPRGGTGKARLLP